MAKLLYKLNGVPEDEADDIRELLDQHGIEFYETSAGRWQISVAAIWIRHNEDYPQAKTLLDLYQEKRFQEARADYLQRIADGTAESFWQRLQREPLRVLIYILAVAFIVYLTVVPFIQWAMH
ncbi:MAG: hypothetical protein K0A95_10470 [Chromatiales bacterium]|nr:hypothetical protein [Gammaproteobacteria bacterium]MBW6477483.1 hypothetical protein [Chromatiales bacterium]